MAAAKKVTIKTSPRRKGTVPTTKVRAAVQKVFTQAYITPKEFLKLPFSDAILQVIEDVKGIKRQGITIDMSSWWGRGPGNEEPCSVCLGGAALCSFAVEKVDGLNIHQYGKAVLGISRSETGRIADSFNWLRAGRLHAALSAWLGRIPGYKSDIEDLMTYCYSYDFHGKMTNRESAKLIHHLQYVSKELRKAGY